MFLDINIVLVFAIAALAMTPLALKFESQETGIHWGVLLSAATLGSVLFALLALLAVELMKFVS